MHDKNYYYEDLKLVNGFKLVINKIARIIRCANSIVRFTGAKACRTK